MTVQQPSDVSPSVEIGSHSPIHSHVGYSTPVEGVCHHSGRYLTRREIITTLSQALPFLREQHDFPGLPELDEVFADAIHSKGHQHLMWNVSGVKGLTSIVSGMLLLLVVAVTASRLLNSGDGFIILLIGGTGLGVTLCSYGAYLFYNRRTLYHRESRGEPPSIRDFPLFGCKYDIVARERLTAHLSNDQHHPVPIQPQRSAVFVHLYPGFSTSNITDLYHHYQQTYADYAVGDHMHAGCLSLQNVRGISCSTLEFGHRLVLRTFIPPSLANGKYTSGPLATVVAPYSINIDSLFIGHDEAARFPLTFEPRMKPNDSYTLELRFRWDGRLGPDVAVMLDECRLSIPAELEPIERVESGRYDSVHQEVIWRDRMLRKRGASTSLTLRVIFGRPLLTPEIFKTNPQLHGSYVCTLDGLISGLAIDRAMIWSVTGKRAVDEQALISIRSSTNLSGDLGIDLRRLPQEAEYVRSNLIMCMCPPNHALLQTLLNVLVRKCGMDILRMEQATPRLDTAGSTDVSMLYWDVFACVHSPDLIRSIHIHMIVAGKEYQEAAPPAEWQEKTFISLHMRCLHNPRDVKAIEHSDTLLKAIAFHIRKHVDAI